VAEATKKAGGCCPSPTLTFAKVNIVNHIKAVLSSLGALFSPRRSSGVSFRSRSKTPDPGPAARTGRAWQNGKSPPLLGFWWASVILMDVMASLSARSAGDASIDLADNAAGLLPTLLAFQVVRLVTARQEASARALMPGV